MIIVDFFNIIYFLFDNFTSFINIPPMNDDMRMYMDELFEYLEAGIGLLASYTHLDYLFILFRIVVSLNAGLFVYRLVMWILKKIPMANIK